MERLTEERQLGPWASLKDKAEAIPGAFSNYDCLMAHLTAVTRLKEYEDTGLTPEQCAEFAKADKNAPAADVAPVVHGRWDGDNCTVCKLPWKYNMVQDADDWGYFDPMPDYCPNCGAKMDGGD